MDLIVIPQALMVVYGAVVLVCGAGLSFILGRNTRRLRGPSSPDDLDRRLRLVEDELGLAQTEIQSLRDERDFLLRLNPVPNHPVRKPQQSAA